MSSLTDTITVYTVDGTTQDLTLTIQGTNDAPVLSSSSYSLSSVIEKIDSLSNNGNTIGEVVSNGISDIDSDPNNLSVAITSLDESNGSWQYRLDAADSWIDMDQASVSESNALLLHASNHIRFSPNEGFHGEAGLTSEHGIKQQELLANMEMHQRMATIRRLALIRERHP